MVAVVEQRRVVIPIYGGVQPLDVTGPHEVLAGANTALDALGRTGPRYAIDVVAAEPGPVRAPSGLALLADGALPRPGAAIDTILVPGGDTAAALAGAGDPLVGWLQASAPHARRVATVCSGAFFAAAAGLCDGKRVTTHWSRAGQLARACPSASVEPDAIYVRSGELWSSAGVTAGIDLALALVEDDVGASVAQLVARHLVVHLRRPGGQTQYAAPVWSDPPTTSPIAAARDIIHADPAAELDVPTLAVRVGLSPRHFTRLFRDQVGEPPARYVERVRIEAARSLLDTSATGLDEIAARCGFGTAETLRRAFHRRLGCAPDAYRRRFRAAAS
jgi:transcriptional regulator GlxA family with amidase domain